MRPLKLVMSGFGPYGSLIELNLDSLGQEGLFLITGDTGAGKTTIFDGITYALYGKSSGGERDGKMLRSQYAEAGTATFVELTFLCHGKEYSICRNPAYLRPKKRGEGFTQTNAGVRLLLPDGQEVTKETEVTTAIQELLGLDHGQFCSLAMIAQGEFRKVLYASTEERSKILRKLFATGLYQLLQNQVKEAADRQTALTKELYDKITHYGQSFNGLGESLDLKLLKDLAKEPKGRVEQILSCSEKLLQDQELALAGFEEQLDKSAARLDQVKKDLDQWAHYNSCAKALAEAQETLASLRAGLSAAKEQQSEAQQAARELEPLGEEARRLQNKLEEIAPLETVKLEQAGLKSQQQEALKKQQALDSSLEAIKAATSQGEQALKPLEGTNDRLEQAQREVQQAEARLLELYNGGKALSTALDNLGKAKDQQKAAEEAKLAAARNLESQQQLLEEAKNDQILQSQQEKQSAALELQLREVLDSLQQYAEYEDANRELATLQNEAKEAITKAQEAVAHYNQLKISFYKNQAGLLAATLEAGSPCPVCGSTAHPHKAVAIEGAASKEQVEAAENASKAAEQRADIAVTKAGSKLEKVNTLKARLTGRPALEEVQGQQARLLAEQQQLAREIAATAAKAKECPKYEKALEESRQQCQAKELELKKAQDKAMAALGQVGQVQGQLQCTLATSLEAEELLQAARAAYGAQNQQFHLLGTRVYDLQEQLKEKEKLEEALTRNREQQELLNLSRQQLQAELAGLEAQLAAAKRRQQELETKIGPVSKLDLEQALAANRAAKSKLEQALEAAAKAVDQASGDYKSCLGKASTLEGQLQQLATTGTEADLQKEQSLLQADNARLQKAVQEAHAVVLNNRQQQQQLQQVAKKLIREDAKTNSLHNLSVVLTGNSSLTKQKMALETYVQTYYFDRILVRANQRLQDMTAGQYRLVRSLDKDGNAKMGLNLNVFDFYSGCERDVKTLSGGECFMASLALALGLADEVQANSGGIRLETLFVDEGFGSLDGDTLNQAVHTLRALSQQGRLVGIISHVKELEQHIPQKIAVRKEIHSNRLTSTATIILE